ncbi:MAG: 2-polyprenyl-6-methoxyphenol hydroxylase-like oxidoreductase [Goleter apudmare HA4340-LM2]|jgi:2-polyprenyl-6-methoxyphenol hydroxylase-like FAD-dependent oxidoreductase|nr:2-polyprenyl-6-methoxyphenol hydroxylase-like oxidoreductase [Goleter apudmare HA4340-LM2]
MVIKNIGQHAIIIGASMGGLLAARALTDYYQQVTLLEQDIFPAPGLNRKGVPQDRHTHGLLAKGREVLEHFFPGITQELEAKTAVIGDVLQLSRWFAEGGYLQRNYSGLKGILVSRPLLEAQVRQRLLTLPNVKVIENCNVLGLVATEDHTRVTGVRLKHQGNSNAEEILNAELVVDASGRRSLSPVWLETLGYEKPHEKQVKVNISYTTRIYSRQPEHIQGDQAVIVTASYPSWRSGVLLAQEQEHWIVSIGGYFSDRAPTDEQGFLEFAKSLPTPDIYEVIKDAEPLSEPTLYKFPSSQRRCYEKLKRFPQGYLVFGDAICSFNPVYGQGMTITALEAIALQDCLSKGSQNLARRFFQAASKVVDIPWSMAVDGDLRIPQVQGKRSLMVRFINWYIGKLQVAAQQDLKVAIAFTKTVNLIAPPATLFSPWIVFRVLLGNLLQAKTAN